MTGWHDLTSAWDWEPSIVIGCVALHLGYAAAVRFKFRRIAWFYAGGVVLLLLALVSPVDALGDIYLFSAHMLQHMVLILVVPPLLLRGIPEDVPRRVLTHQTVRRMDRMLNRPIRAWSIGLGTMWIWHCPPLYNATPGSLDIHIYGRRRRRRHLAGKCMSRSGTVEVKTMVS